MPNQTRRLILATVVTAGAIGLLHATSKHYDTSSGQPFKRVGTTFSVPYAEWLNQHPRPGTNWQEVCKQLAAAGFDVIRLPLQWNQVEKKPGVYDFGTYDDTVRVFKAYKTSVIPALGIKVPRYPEVHLPAFYQDGALTRVRKNETEASENVLFKPLMAWLAAAIVHFDALPNVEAIQIENEPLEATGPDNTTIPMALLVQEVKLVRDLSNKPIIVTMGAGMTESVSEAEVKRPAMLNQLLSLDVDRIGFNLYDRGNGGGFRCEEGHWRLLQKMMAMVRAAHKTPFIAELQGEPWERDANTMVYDQPNGNSYTPEEYLAFARKASTMGCDIWLWGTEFQSACLNRGNTAWSDTTAAILDNRKS